MASRERTSYRCSECGWSTPKWVGRCGECQAWGTVGEPAPAVARTVAGPVTSPARPICDVDVEAARSRPTGSDELDRVLGGGLVPGSVVLLAGEPGVGKSTLLLDVAARWAAEGGRALYVTGEESAPQVRLRAERISALADGLYLAAETDLAAVLGHVDAVAPSLLVVDSVQTIASQDVDGGAGGVSQVREVALALIRVAKERGIATVLVGHVTKEGAVAGPRMLEHLVDVVLHFEGDRHARLRLVRAVKNRYGAADEVGCFELTEIGIVGLPDPSGMFLSARASTVPGTAVTVALEGRRPLVVEVQSLVTASPQPRRTISGLDASRVAMVLGVLDRRVRLRLGTSEVFAATVGGVRIVEPAADLAVALAVASGISDVALPAGLVAFGEVGLAGDLRRVVGVQRRVQEAARLGFTDALAPPDSGDPVEGITVHEVRTLSEAITVAARLGGAAPATDFRRRA